MPNRSGSAAAASITASAFSSVRRDIPVAIAALSAALPLEASGNLPEALPRSSALTLPFLRGGALFRLEIALGGHSLGNRERLSMDIFGEFRPRHLSVGEIAHDGEDVGLPVELGGSQSARATCELISIAPGGPDDDRLKYIDAGDIGRERAEIAHIAAVSRADGDLLDG